MAKRQWFRRWLPPAMPLLAPLIAFWQVTLCLNTLKWDNMDQYFPNRHFISESLGQGLLPFWNPHIQLGLPMAADPQSGVFYPPVTFIASVFGYDVCLFQWELLLHIIWAGLGAYFLLRMAGMRRLTAATFAVVYQLSGPFVSNAQHLTWIVSASWLPWILLSFFALSRGGGWRWSILLAVSVFCSLSGGYPAFFFVWIYILAIWTAVHFFTQMSKRQNRRAVGFLVNVVLAAVLAGLLLSGYLWAVVESMPHVNRGGGIDIGRALEGSMSPLALVTLLFPHVNAHPEVMNGFNSMMNNYAGFLFIPFVFLLMSSRSLRNRTYILFFLGTLFLMLGFGQHLPFRRWLYELPLMDLFRFPALFRIFALMAWIWASAELFEHLFEKKQARRRFLIILAVWFVVVLLIALQAWNVTLSERDFTGPWEFVARQSIWLLPILLLSLAAMTLVKGQRARYLLAVLLVLDMMAAAQFNIRANVIAERRPASLQAFLDTHPEGFPLPDINKPMLEYGMYNPPEYDPMTYHHSYFTKGFAHDGYYPFSLADLKAFDKHPQKWERLKMPLVFYTAPGMDSSFRIPVDILSWRPGEILLQVEAPMEGRLVYFQNDYLHWKAEVDGQPESIVRSWDTLIGLDMRAGSHRVRIYYEQPVLSGLYLFSYGLFIALLALLVFSFVKNRKFRQ